ncbi:Protein-serine/threonine phosphatase protein [Dioscorea alata]|uniref:Protein-serine/threonine phosphatase protein n=1 Tax=Dioscorea alata TaxID=55571 RepID=A0ACB7WF51_DIOAL|nr:Protein-serine/threonine phosphatase protein [Dioscorea alata]
MGMCLSSSYEGKEESDENIVCRVEEGGLCCNNGEEKEEEVEGIKSLVSLYSQQGKKGPNQDSAILYQGYGMEGVFCGVFDGHGRNGHMVSRLVRDYLPSILINQRDALMLADNIGVLTDSDDDSSVDDEDYSLPSPEWFDEWKQACINGFKAMDKELTFQPNLDCTYSGTTAVTIIKKGNDLIIANLGDSRAVLGTISDDGFLKAVQLTTDLKPDLPEEAERIRKKNGRVFALRDEPRNYRVWLPNDNFPGLAMARAFGDLQLKNYGIIAVPQVSYHLLTSRDQFIVLATDGVWDVLTNDQVAAIVWSTSRKEEASKAVVDAAVHAWRRKYPASRADDCTAVCLFLQDLQI